MLDAVEADKMSGLGGGGVPGLVAEDMVREEEDVKVRESSGRRARNEADGKKERERH
jgi:hypothetical protein